METISPIYDNVSIEEWAQSIRQIKISELKEEIRIHKKILLNSPCNKLVQKDIDRLTRKLKILEAK